jgi:hypothetical protein
MAWLRFSLPVRRKDERGIRELHSVAKKESKDKVVPVLN